MSKPQTPRQNPQAKPGSLQRLVRRRGSHCLKSSPTKISLRAATAGDVTALGS
jgi:hypothetical protein